MKYISVWGSIMTNEKLLSENNSMEFEKINLNASIGIELNWFLDHISSLVSTIGPLMMLLGDVGKKYSQEKLEFEEKYCTFGNIKKTSTNSSVREINVPIDKRMKWKKLTRKDKTFRISYKLIPRSVFVSLVSTYDAYIGKLLRILYLITPEVLNSSDKKISFSGIMEFSCLEEAREWIIEKEVEDVLRKNHIDQLKYIGEKFSIKIEPNKYLYKNFIELTERRNLFVHCDGKVSKQYIEICKKNDINTNNNKIGDDININGEYLEQSYDTLYEMATEITHVLWRKFFPKDIEPADKNLIDITYDLICIEKYNLAQKLLNFSCQNYIKHHDDEYKFIFIVNRALSYHLDIKDDECKNILEQYDWSAKSHEFKLANFVLNEEWDNATMIMGKIGKSEEWPVKYRDWPLFTKFRDTKEFLSQYQKIYGINFLEETATESIPSENSEAEC